MKLTSETRTAAVLALACALLFPGAARADNYKELSMRISRCAAENSVKKIALLDFAAKGGAGKSETEYAAEKIGVFLAGSKTFSLIERRLLEKVLKETRLSSLADGGPEKTEILKNILSVDAVVTGTVFADGDKLKVLAKLIEIRTGRVLLAAESEAGRMRPDFPETSFDGMGLPDVPMPKMADWPADLRDAVAEPEAGSCAGRRLAVARLNEELVEAKAWYWAVKMRKPGFKTSALTRNPGSEISDPAVRARFYKLLAAYHGSAAGPSPDPGQMSELLDLLRTEARVADECGIN